MSLHWVGLDYDAEQHMPPLGTMQPLSEVSVHIYASILRVTSNLYTNTCLSINNSSSRPLRHPSLTVYSLEMVASLGIIECWDNIRLVFFLIYWNFYWSNYSILTCLVHPSSLPSFKGYYHICFRDKRSTVDIRNWDIFPTTSWPQDKFLCWILPYIMPYRICYFCSI